METCTSGDIDLGNSMEYLEFYENGKVRYERGVGTDDYSLIESQLEYETDWALSYNDGNIIRMSGHILFMMWGEGLYLDEPNRFLCWVENDKMWLLPDDGDRYIMNPTLLFTKVK